MLIVVLLAWILRLEQIFLSFYVILVIHKILIIHTCYVMYDAITLILKEVLCPNQAV